MPKSGGSTASALVPSATVCLAPPKNLKLSRAPGATVGPAPLQYVEMSRRRCTTGACVHAPRTYVGPGILYWRTPRLSSAAASRKVCDSRDTRIRVPMPCTTPIAQRSPHAFLSAVHPRLSSSASTRRPRTGNRLPQTNGIVCLSTSVWLTRGFRVPSRMVLLRIDSSSPACRSLLQLPRLSSKDKEEMAWYCQRAVGY